jgi:hypothetical protein
VQQNRGPVSKTSRPGRPWRDPGKRNDARELHALVYGWFTEGFETLDLKEAKALLDELAHERATNEETRTGTSVCENRVNFCFSKS